METRASYVLVGGFVLAMLAGLALLVVWLARVQIDESFDNYRIAFEGSVSGLQSGSQVRYRGIPVGRVTDIRINPDNVGEVLTTIEVQEDTPIKTDTVAAIEQQGITGIAGIQLSGGSQAAAMLEAGAGEEMATIESTPSAFQRLSQEAPDLLTSTLELANRGHEVLSEKNLQSFETLLTSASTLSSRLAGRSDELEAMLGELRTAIQSLESTSGDVGELADAGTTRLADLDARLDRLESALNQGIGDVRKSARSMETAAVRLGGFIDSIDQPFRDFSQSGLYELTQLIGETRQLVATASRIAREFERDPTGFFLGGTSEGLRVE